MDFDAIPLDNAIQKTAEALKTNGITVIIAENGQEAKAKALELIPTGAEVMNMTSMTLETITVPHEIANSGKYISVRKKLETMTREKQGLEMNRLGAAPEYTIGSVHAVTQDGRAMIASNTGSQLPAYAYGANKVIWVVGAQKIVKDINEGLKRIYEHSLILERERVKKAYGSEFTSNPNKILIVSGEIIPDRITMILVKEKLGF